MVKPRSNTDILGPSERFERTFHIQYKLSIIEFIFKEIDKHNKYNEVINCNT